MKQTWINIGGTWKMVTSVWQNVNGTWKQDVMPKININGTYKECMSYWNPTSISGLVLWLDATTISGVSDQANLSQWNDLSGYNNHATQTTSSLQPTYILNGIDGKPSVRFGGTTVKHIDSPSLGMGARTYFVVLRRTGVNAGSYDSHNIIINPNTPYYQLYAIEGGTYKTYSSGGSVSSTGTIDNTKHLVTARWDTLTRLYKNGVEVGNGPGTNIFTNQKLQIGGFNTTYGLTGDISEVLIYNRRLDYDEIDEIELYLMDKWNI